MMKKRIFGGNILRVFMPFDITGLFGEGMKFLRRRRWIIRSNQRNNLIGGEKSFCCFMIKSGNCFARLDDDEAAENSLGVEIKMIMIIGIIGGVDVGAILLFKDPQTEPF